MSKRKSSRDLMADLLSDKPTPVSQTGEISKARSSAELLRRSTAARSNSKVKMTLSLPSHVADRLTQFETEMRLETGERGHALAKSAIISAALEMMFDEYDVERMESRLARRMDPRRNTDF